MRDGFVLHVPPDGGSKLGHTLHHLFIVREPLVDFHVLRPRRVQNLFEKSAGQGVKVRERK